MSTLKKKLHEFMGREINIIDVKDVRHRSVIKEIGDDFLIAETASVRMLFNLNTIVRVEEGK